MMRHMLFAGLAGAVLASACAGGALAQARYYPDGTNCSLLSDAELVACQNQLYARQLRSGESRAATGPADQTVIPGSNPAGVTAGASSFVPGAEGTAPLNPPLPRPEGAAPLDGAQPTVLGAPTVLSGPEGTLQPAVPQ
jgi:hypothetical protein